MIKSMTGFSKTETKENGVNLAVELKSLNGRYLEVSCKIPRSLSHKEFEIREMLKSSISRGNIFISINIETNLALKQNLINEEAAVEYFKALKRLKKKLNVQEPVRFNELLTFAANFYTKENGDNSELEWRIAKKTISNALKYLDRMRLNEGQQIIKDVLRRIKNISVVVDKVEKLGLKKIPDERERLRQRVAKLFESDEIDEHRIQMELVLLADKLDISEECVRLRSHIKFFYETLKSNEPIGRKLNFLIQEMNREVNTIGSKANDTEIAHLVVETKEDLERIREQIQNIE
ncbi:MAG: YicC family protein [Ignavibacteria bacterium GWB2_35_12]|nr:MAG: YicC family protein [Ignavibacteria bacterium GWA2_35_8]OGU41420.1 MAG: YicC family protein [Ignavibacteria bacterium GWB2_35_12]OGU95017.1 MAG: YicC family protein [Ignavibacteria bacterium RIFOXYA2_FULL_35_10]OGV19404.1 MAG: YicC family protein [Ignavibacteria bacterium RIFOXYC2_FULL_35_21]